MASQNAAGDVRHLDATAGRDVVFCHACEYEWYRDQQGLTCPRCLGDITEIIEPANDPRNLGHRSSASTSPEIAPLRFGGGDDSDPDEADINDLAPGLAFSRNTRTGPDHPHHHNPAIDPVLERFLTMVSGFGPPRRTPSGGPHGPNQAGAGHTHVHTHANNQPAQETFMQPRIQRTTFTSGSFSGGTTSVTFVSGPLHGPLHGGPAGAMPGGPGPDPFQTYAPPSPSRPRRTGGLRVTSVTVALGANQPPRIFSNIVQDLSPPEEGNRAPSENFPGGPTPGFARSLHDILNLLNPANAMAGDAVYSQEALDRIITGLMEANPQSNAAPPASEAALQNLTRKPVDKEMLGGDDKVECTICIDEMKEGETVVYLPCNHWFHEACVVLWLKEHNTCPICRTPIEKNERNRNNGNSGNGDDNTNASQASPRPTLFPNNSGSFMGGPGWMSFPPPPPGGSSGDHHAGQTRPARPSRPPSQSQSRLNEALRNMTSSQRERERDRDRGASSSVFYDTSRLQRRNSHSPTSPRSAGPEEHRARMRQRSPSESSRRSSDRDQRRGSGPIGWLRDQFSRGGGPGNGSSREARRQ
ncbi:hypothetical protein EDB81DRAFT_695013 [Dactylonectria macrodidyma]|uniref:RING-type E3 ubiquitin transferase n=1 Tax=Dactylonectria macrodidyma TaxID=307937 RepID=A0A9P9EAB2_9HYPO|nr:hypothetical protein EDB81DRAFT_695013 [Dactylonectria macrodidyma]